MSEPMRAPCGCTVSGAPGKEEIDLCDVAAKLNREQRRLSSTDVKSLRASREYRDHIARAAAEIGRQQGQPERQPSRQRADIHAAGTTAIVVASNGIYEAVAGLSLDALRAFIRQAQEVAAELAGDGTEYPERTPLSQITEEQARTRLADLWAATRPVGGTGYTQMRNGFMDGGMRMYRWLQQTASAPAPGVPAELVAAYQQIIHELDDHRIPWAKLSGSRTFADLDRQVTAALKAQEATKHRPPPTDKVRDFFDGWYNTGALGWGEPARTDEPAEPERGSLPWAWRKWAGGGT